MTTTVTFDRDSYGRAMLTARIQSHEPSHVLAFAEYDDTVWWTKSPVATTEHGYSALYHHVYRQNEQRQVIVTCGGIIQDCVIPTGYDPSESQVLTIEPMIPATIYLHGTHRLGLILLPKDVTKSMRNRIWRLKPEWNSPELKRFAEALSHGRCGTISKDNEKSV